MTSYNSKPLYSDPGVENGMTAATTLHGHAALGVGRWGIQEGPSKAAPPGSSDHVDSPRSHRSSDDGYKSSNEETPPISKRNSTTNDYVTSNPSLTDVNTSSSFSEGKKKLNVVSSPPLPLGAPKGIAPRSPPPPLATKTDASTNHICILSPSHLSNNHCTAHNAPLLLSQPSEGATSFEGYRTPFPNSPGLDVSSSSSIGGHHLSLNMGDRFMKQANSRREELFYSTIAPYQCVLVEQAVRHTDRTISAWSGEKERLKEYDERGSNTDDDSSEEVEVEVKVTEGEENSRQMKQDRLLRLFRIIEHQNCAEHYSHFYGNSGEDNPTTTTTTTNSTAEEAEKKLASRPTEIKTIDEELKYLETVSDAEMEKIRLAASLWWTQHWRGPVLRLGKCFGEDLASPHSCLYNHHTLEVHPTTPLTSCSNTTQVFSEYRLPTEESRRAAEEKALALTLLCPFTARFFGLRVTTAETLRRLTWTEKENHSQDHHNNNNNNRIPHDADDELDDKPIRLTVLEDVCFGFSYPCVLDMKMGSRQYGLNASERKRRSKEYKARHTTSWEYGIRLAGVRRWDPDLQSYYTKTKLQCRPLTFNEIKEELTLFCGERRLLELSFVRQLQSLREAFQRQTVYRFYTSSLLFVYDYAAPLQTARIVMVDFAYTYERKELVEAKDEDGQYDYDINYIKALDSLLSLLS